MLLLLASLTACQASAAGAITPGGASAAPATTSGPQATATTLKPHFS